MTPAITTVIPTFRRPATLRRALSSALAQSYANTQVLVMDDASGDETEAVVRSLNDSRVDYRRQSANIGYARNTAFAVDAVRTEFFSILADDDLLLPDFYQHAMNALARFPEADFCFGTVLAVGPSGEARAGRTLNYPEGFYPQPQALLASVRNGHPNWVGVLFRTRTLEKAGPLDPSFRAIDFDFQLRCAARCSYVVLHAPVAVFSVHSGSISTGGDRRKFFDLVWPSTRDSIDRLAADDAIPEPIRAGVCHRLRSTLAKQLFDLALADSGSGELDLAQRIQPILRRDLGARGLAAMLSCLAPAFRSRHLFRMLCSLRRWMPSGRAKSSVYTSHVHYYRNLGARQPAH
jgi:hypothetical protein